jgi:iron-sulfur cluster assembly protein
MKSLLEGKDYLFVRLGVKSGGCSGFSNFMEFSNEIEEGDEVLDQHGIKVLIDSKSQLFLFGTEIDYVEELLQSGFVFNNPMHKNQCGCGSSFSV